MLEYITAVAAIVNLLLLLGPGIWWAATMHGKVNRLHKSYSILQSLRTKIAILEERTGGQIHTLEERESP